ncbi:unnamed protein product, partial [Sphacelaria rigidula]
GSHENRAFSASSYTRAGLIGGAEAFCSTGAGPRVPASENDLTRFLVVFRPLPPSPPLAMLSLSGCAPRLHLFPFPRLRPRCPPSHRPPPCLHHSVHVCGRLRPPSIITVYTTILSAIFVAPYHLPSPR